MIRVVPPVMMGVMEVGWISLPPPSIRSAAGLTKVVLPSALTPWIPFERRDPYALLPLLDMMSETFLYY